MTPLGATYNINLTAQNDSARGWIPVTSTSPLAKFRIFPEAHSTQVRVSTPCRWRNACYRVCLVRRMFSTSVNRLKQLMPTTWSLVHRGPRSTKVKSRHVVTRGGVRSGCTDGRRQRPDTWWVLSGRPERASGDGEDVGAAGGGQHRAA